MYYLRLDDASPFANQANWSKMENLLDKYGVKPIVGIIPDNQDPSMLKNYQQNLSFWDDALRWQSKGWLIALHGYHHLYTTTEGGINPVHQRSEFAGLPMQLQKDMLQKGCAILRSHHIEPKAFFAPSHTFDEQTVTALLEGTSIRMISDTIAWNVYWKNGMFYLPQQAGRVRRLPFRFTTFCYHPNTMNDSAFEILESFLKKNQSKFGDPSSFALKKRHLSLFDRALRALYLHRKKRD
jgi:predicted deacetylase